MTSPTSRNSTCEKRVRKQSAEKQGWRKRKNRRWCFCYQETCEESKVLLDFFQKIAGMEGAEPRRPDKIRTPEKPLAGRTAWPAFPAGGKPRFFTGCTPIFRCSASATFPEGDNLRKLFAGHAVRPANNFLRAAKQTGVQQHPKNASKTRFRQIPASGCPGAGFLWDGSFPRTFP